ncbi:MAG: DUF5337 family protein [Cypionkella sp.]|nr:DUF5337 family protein [Cypionkella sp.]
MALAKQARLAALVLIGTVVLWLVAQKIGGEMGWPPKFVLLFDFAALAGFAFALVVTYRIWRARRN